MIDVATEGKSSDDECNYTQTWTATYTDGCGNEAEAVSVTYTWKEDNTAPIITEDVEDKDLGCNPEEIIFDEPIFAGGCTPLELQGEPVLGDLIVDGCAREQTKTWTVTDCSGLETTTSQTLNWTIDTEAPLVVNNIDDKDLGYNPSSIDFDEPIFDGGCSEAFPVEGYPMIDDVVEDGCNRSQVSKWKVTDCSGLITTVEQTLTWIIDNEAPEIVVDAIDKDLGCNPEEVLFDEPEFDGVCSDVVPLEGYPMTGEVIEDGCDRTQTKTWMVTDESQILTVVTQTITWIVDVDPPMLMSALEPLDLGCNPENIIFDEPQFEANCTEIENLDGYPQLSAISEDGCLRSQTKTWRVTDCSEEITEVSQTATWSVDTEDPVITFVNPMLVGFQNGDVMQVQCYGQDPNWQLPEASLADVSVSDNCLAEVDVQVTEVKIGDGNCEEDGYIQRLRCSWTATDACGNSSILFIFMEIVDTIAPVLYGVPDDIVVTCDNIPEPANVTGLDECLCADIALEEEVVTGECIEDQQIVRTWTATDCCGNVSSSTQIISFTDEIAPTLVVTLPGDVTIDGDYELEFDCNSGGIPAEYGELSADNAESEEGCSGEAQIAFSDFTDESENCKDGAVAIQTTTWTAFDACGNEQEITLTIRVTDNTPPVFYGLEYACGESEDDLFVYAIDACTKAQTSFVEREVEGTCGRVVEREYYGKDRCGNATTFIQTVVYEDTISPTITLMPASLDGLASGSTVSVQCGTDFSEFSLSDATFLDECDFPLETSFEETDLSTGGCADGAIAMIELKWTAIDLCGNTTEFIIIAEQVDDVAPSIGQFSREITVACNRDIKDIEATDECSAVEVEYEDEIIPGACPNTYDIIRTIIATDGCGNVASAEQTIHIVDNQGPQLMGLEEYVCEDLGMPEVYAIDNCDSEDIEISMVQDTLFSQDCGEEFRIRRMWSAIDACGNTSEFEQIISIDDETAPELIHSAEFMKFEGNSVDVFLSNPADIEYVNSIAWYTVLGRDQCTGAILSPEFTENVTVSEDCAKDGWLEQRMYKWEISDVCGNTSSIQLNLNIVDDVDFLQYG